MIDDLDKPLDTQPVVVMMPFLGGSVEEWAEVSSRLSPRLRCVGIDLPGFGGAAEVAGYSVEAMVEYVCARLKALKLGWFVLVGHSMAGKVSMAVARRAVRDGELVGLQGLVLVCSSPPSPEPMEEHMRAEMKINLGTSGPEYRHHAEAFIRENTAEELIPAVFQRAVGDVLRMNMAAWNAWLDSGSKEDWSERIDILDLPALVIAGERDKALGVAAQRGLVMPHLSRARLEVIAGAAHLIPMERPVELAALLFEFADDLTNAVEAKSNRHKLIDREYLSLIESDRVSKQTRAVLLRRMQPPDEPRADHVLTVDERETLQAAAECIAPMVGRSIEFALLIEARLYSGKSKGWRYAALPSDLDAYRAALSALDRCAHRKFGGSFAACTAAGRNGVLRIIELGQFESIEVVQPESPNKLTSTQMQRWFEDLRSEVTGLYMSHPETLAEIGYSGIADGHDSAALTGFVQLGLDKIESWEAKAKGVGE